MWLLTNPIGRYILAGVAAVLLIGGAAFYVYHKGETDQANKGATEVVKETDDARKDREKVDAGERARDDDAATKCLRNPTGC